MAKVKITGHASGTGVVTVTAPNTSTDRTITLPDATGTLLNSDGDGSSLTGVGVTGITSSANSNAMTIGSDENITISNGNDADTVLTIDSQTANGNVGILKLAGDVQGGGFGAGYQSAKINFFQSAEHICTISSKRSEGDEGELSFQTRDASDSAPVERLIIKKDGRGLSQFTAKAWVHFNGSSTVAIRDSHNVSSITDLGTGQYLVNFSNNLANGNFSAVANAELAVSIENAYTSANGSDFTTSRFKILHYENNGTQDSAYITGIAFGD